ncbi:MAG: hypothetical protein CMJ89_10125 [Planctomycetes bacterium]|jgi:hypothetical protein|nr:hypothetical protein [Planctomycetota bacterium]
MRGLALFCAALAPIFAQAEPQLSDRPSSVGIPVWVREIVLPGSRLEVKPSDLKTPLTVRISDVYSHGDAFRYNIEYYGLEAGSFDLRDFLRRADGSGTDDLPHLTVVIESVQGPGQVEPGSPREGRIPRVGGYHVWLWIGGVLWLAGLWAILRVTRREDSGENEATLRPMTLAERLRPLVERAMKGELARVEQAELELALIAFWRKKLELEDDDAARAITQLKAHAEAGPLLVQLEQWLHQRRTASSPAIDLTDLLAPYRDLPADALPDGTRSEARKAGQPAH